MFTRAATIDDDNAGTALWYRSNRDRCDRPSKTCRSGSSSA